MQAKRFLFVVMLYVMAVAAFVVFASNAIPWFQFRLSAQTATLFLQPEPAIQGPDDERKLAADQRANGRAVQLQLASGERIASHARLTTEQLKRASNGQGIHVLFRKDGPNKVQVINGLEDLESPWLWLGLCAVFSILAPYARRLYAKESE